MKRPGLVDHRRSILLSFAAVLALAGPAAASTYKVTDLRPSAAQYAEATALNNQGQVAGTMTIPPGNHQPGGGFGFLYDPNAGGRVTLFGVTSPSGRNPGSLDWQGRATAINDLGQVAGVNNQNGQVFVYDNRSGQTTYLPAYGQGGSGARAITNSGEVFKTYIPPDGSTPGEHPSAYQNGSFTNLGMPPGTVAGSILGANDAGHVLVSAFTSLYAPASTYLLSGGQWTNLGSFSGSALNARGDAVGSIRSATGDGHAAFLPHGGSPVDLGTLPGFSTGNALGVNARGDVVGGLYSGSGSHGFLYQDGVLKDLNSLIGQGTGWTIQWGQAINDRGQILAYGDNGTAQHVLLLTPDGQPTPPDPVMPALPVPEPGPFVLFGGLAAWLGWRARRRVVLS